MTDRPPESVSYRPIGIVRSPYTVVDGMPIQAAAAAGVRATIELDPDLADGLADLDGFSHVLVISHLHAVVEARLRVTPFLDGEPRGIFATRSPTRPNPIGLSTVRLLEIVGTTLHVDGIDLLDGTPVLDLKPYVPAFDDRADARIGWYADRLDRLATTRSDDRFEGSTG